MVTIELKAGGTFSYLGTITPLDPVVSWGIASAVKLKLTDTAVLDTLTASIEAASTPGLFNFRLYATEAQVSSWYAASLLNRGLLVCDIKFFNTAAPDPVARTETFQISIVGSVTP